MWYGRKSRLRLDSLQWEAKTVQGRLGVPVTPVVCIADSSLFGAVGEIVVVGPSTIVGAFL